MRSMPIPSHRTDKRLSPKNAVRLAKGTSLSVRIASGRPDSLKPFQMRQRRIPPGCSPRNHGTITVSRTIPQAYQRMYWLAFVPTSGGRAGRRPGTHAATADDGRPRVQGQNRDGIADLADRSWSAQLRRLDRIDPGFRN
jgi:hypothetical protein